MRAAPSKGASRWRLAVFAAAGGGLSTSVTPEVGVFRGPAQGCGPHVWLSPRARAEYERFTWNETQQVGFSGVQPKAVDPTYGSALGLGPSIGRLLDASEVIFPVIGRYYWMLPFGRLK